jgi:hypothetical protein
MLNHRAVLRGIVAAGLAAGAAPAQEAPTANLCLAAEYVYAGARLLAVDRGPLPTVSFQSSLSSPSEAGANAPVAVVVTTAGGCTTGGNVVVQYSTGPGTATAGTDYTAVPAGSLTIPAGTASGAGADINIALTNDPLDEDGETFTVNLSSPTGAVLAPPFLHTVTIADDDPEPVLAITDTSTVEPATVDVLATHTVSLIPQSGRTVTVNYGTADGTATAGPDFTPVSGVLTFPPGTTSRQVQVAVRPDDLDEPNETFFVNLGPAVNVNVPASDMVGEGTIQDIDPPPSVSVANASQFEGDEGGNRLDFLVSLSGASGFPITVNYTTADGTAVAPGDYAFTSGQVSFATGETTRPAPVALVTDAQAEPDETLLVNLSAPVNATLGVSQATGVIRNDDPGRQAAVELSHAAEQTQDLRAIAGVAATHWYRIGQKPRSSYEVVVDATSGDVGTDTGLELARVLGLHHRAPAVGGGHP